MSNRFEFTVECWLYMSLKNIWGWQMDKWYGRMECFGPCEDVVDAVYPSKDDIFIDSESLGESGKRLSDCPKCQGRRVFFMTPDGTMRVSGGKHG